MHLASNRGARGHLTRASEVLEPSSMIAMSESSGYGAMGSEKGSTGW